MFSVSSRMRRLALRELERIELARDREKRLLPKEAEEEAVVLARTDPNAFAEYCFSDDKGQSLKQAPHHVEWQELFNHHAVAILGATELGKTSQVSIRLTWELGKDIEKRWAIIGASQKAAQKILGPVKRAIVKNERVRKVFPHLLRGDTWTANEIMVQRQRLETKDFSVQAFGWDSEDVLGIRADGIVADDINNLKNSRTEESRKKIVEQFDSVVESRLMAGGKVFVIGNAWHPEDLIHTLAKRAAFKFRKYPILRYVDGEWVSVWPEQFPMSRIAEIRGRTTSIAFARMRLCQALSDETARFEEEWFEWAKEAGAGIDYSPSQILEWPRELGGGDVFVYSGVDIASGKRGRKRKNDLSSIVTIAINPRTRRYLLLDVQSGRWKAPELLRRMRALARRYDPLFAVEDNGVQQMLIDFAIEEAPARTAEERFERPPMKVIGLTTTSGKWQPETGVEGLAIDFEQRRMIIPSQASPIEVGGSMFRVAEPVGNLLHNLLYFQPTEHTSDDVMALWIAWTAARKYHRNPFDTKATVLG